MARIVTPVTLDLEWLATTDPPAYAQTPAPVRYAQRRPGGCIAPDSPAARALVRDLGAVARRRARSAHESRLGGPRAQLLRPHSATNRANVHRRRPGPHPLHQRV